MKKELPIIEESILSGKMFQWVMWLAVCILVFLITWAFFGFFPMLHASVLSLSQAQTQDLQTADNAKSAPDNAIYAISIPAQLDKTVEKIYTVRPVTTAQTVSKTKTPVPTSKSASSVNHAIGSEAPTRIVIAKVGVDSPISNPERKAVWALDEALQSGVVRYPGSGLPGEPGNILLLGHSSHLKIVYNKAYRALNDIGTLSVGDEIDVYSKSHKYVYRVSSVVLSKDSDVEINLKSDIQKLTLVTCNNFGAKEDRFVVVAELATII
ncbi:MAG: sortase [Candidatus Taylorbacteria bacterium]